MFGISVAGGALRMTGFETAGSVLAEIGVGGMLLCFVPVLLGIAFHIAFYFLYFYPVGYLLEILKYIAYPEILYPDLELCPKCGQPLVNELHYETWERVPLRKVPRKSDGTYNLRFRERERSTQSRRLGPIRVKCTQCDS